MFVSIFSIYFGAGEGSETKSSLWINIGQILHRLNCGTNPCLTCYFAHVADVNMRCSTGIYGNESSLTGVGVQLAGL
jgi:hypothetical protein